jgi:hypothetical protein
MKYSRTIFWYKKQNEGDIIEYDSKKYKVNMCCRYQATTYYLTITEV